MSHPHRRGACPGLSSPMPTGDGLLVRLLPTAPIGLDRFAALCAAARRHGNGTVEVTARGSIQVRGLTPDTAPLFAAEVAALAIAADGGVPVITGALDDPDALFDAAALATELRRAIAAARLAIAPKVSVVIDGGERLHLDALSADIRLRAFEIAQRPKLCVAVGGDAATATILGSVAPRDAVDVVLDLLRAIAARGSGARAADIIHHEGAGAFFGAVARGVFEAAPAASRRIPAEAIGRHRVGEGTFALGVGLAFGHTSADALADLADQAVALGAHGVRPAPGRVLLLTGAADAGATALSAAAERLGFIVDPADPRRRIVACPGTPACTLGLIAARALAAAVAPQLARARDGTPVHISGCPKGCAHPAPAALTVVGTEHGCGIVHNGTAHAVPHRFINPADLAAEIAHRDGAVLAERTHEAVHG